jgi:hypothetical protein
LSSIDRQTMYVAGQYIMAKWFPFNKQHQSSGFLWKNFIG